MTAPPPGPPSPPTPGEPPILRGKVLGMDKYIFVPPTDCDTLLEDETGYCQPCEADDDCVENLACVSLSQPNNTMEFQANSLHNVLRKLVYEENERKDDQRRHPFQMLKPKLVRNVGCG